MTLKEKMLKLQKESELRQVRLEENKVYNAVISSAYYGKNTKGYNSAIFELKIINDAELEGKTINKTFVIDETNSSKLQTEIALQELFRLLVQFNISFETEKDLALALPTLIEREVTIIVRYKENKQNPEKPWPNYTINVK